MRVLNIFNRVLSLPQSTSEMAEMKLAYLAEKKMSEDSIKAAIRQVLEITPENTHVRLSLIDILWRDSVNEEVVRECNSLRPRGGCFVLLPWLGTLFHE